MADLTPAQGSGQVFPGDHRQYIGQVEPLVDSQPTDTRRWQPVYPDRIPPRPGLPAALQPTFSFDPFPRTEPAITAFGWRPTYPDRIHRKTLPAADHPFLFSGATSSTIPSTDLRWQGTFPAFVVRRIPQPWLPMALSVANLVPIPNQNGDATAGRPSASGLIRRPPSLQYTSLAGPVTFPAAFNGSDLSWTSRYPDWLTPPRLRQATTSVLDPLPLPNVATLTAWIAIYPDRLPPPLLRQPIASVSNLDPIPNPTAPTFVGAFYPSRFPAKSPHAALYASSTSQPIADAAEGRILEWQAYRIDRIYRTHLHPAHFQTLGFDPIPQPDAGDMNWRPAYPDSLRRPSIQPQQELAFAFLTPTVQPIADTRWKAIYPDWLERPRGLKAFLQQPFVINVDPIPNVAPTDMKWQGRFPDQLWTKTSIRTASQVFSVRNLVPIPQPAAPTFAGSAIFPAFILRAHLRLTGGSFAPIPEPLLLSPLVWKGIYPDWLTHRPPPPPPFGTFNFSTQPDIPITQGWRPTYPDRLWSRPPLVSGQGVWQIDSATLGNLAICVHWCEEALTQPVFQTEALIRPGFCQNEALMSPTFQQEALC